MACKYKINGLELTKNEFLNYVKKQPLEESAKILGISVTPSAPFITDTNKYVQLGLRVALKEAVKQGADKIAWTTGEQQNGRYSLEKSVDKIEVENIGFGIKYVRIFPKGESYNSLEVNSQGIITKHAQWEGKRLDDVIGKDMSDKIMSANENRTFEGNDLKVGGKGMKGFYGSPTEGSLGIVGNVAKSLFKQEPKVTDFGAKIEIVDGKIIKNGKEVGNINKSKFEGDFIVENNETGERYAVKSEKDAINIFKEALSEQHSVDITPELKAQVEKGLPKFAKDAEVYRGVAIALASGQNIVAALESPAPTTFAHEAIFHSTIEPFLETDTEAKQTFIDEYNEQFGTDKKDWDTEISERTARVYERFLSNGRKLTAAEVKDTKRRNILQKAFDAFTELMKDLIIQYKGKNIEVSPAAQAYFDKITGITTPPTAASTTPTTTAADTTPPPPTTINPTTTEGSKPKGVRQRFYERILAAPNIPQELKDLIIEGTVPKGRITDASLNELADIILAEADAELDINPKNAVKLYEELIEELGKSLAPKIAMDRGMSNTGQSFYEIVALGKIASRLSSMDDNKAAFKALKKIADIGSNAGSVLRLLAVVTKDPNAFLLETIGEMMSFEAVEAVLGQEIEEGGGMTHREGISSTEATIQAELKESLDGLVQDINETISKTQKGTKKAKEKTEESDKAAKKFDAKAAEYLKAFKEKIRNLGKTGRSVVGIDPAMLSAARDFVMYSFYKFRGSLAKVRRDFATVEVLDNVKDRFDDIIQDLREDGTLDVAEKEIARDTIIAAIGNTDLSKKTAQKSPAQLIADRITAMDAKLKGRNKKAGTKTLREKLDNIELDTQTLREVRNYINGELMGVDEAKRTELMNGVDDLIIALSSKKNQLTASKWVTAAQVRKDFKAALEAEKKNNNPDADVKNVLADLVKGLVTDNFDMSTYTESIAKEFIQRTGFTADEAAPFIKVIEDKVKAYVNTKIRERVEKQQIEDYKGFLPKIQENAKVLDDRIKELESKDRTNAETVELKDVKRRKEALDRKARLLTKQYEKDIKTLFSNKVVNAIAKGGLNEETVLKALADKLGIATLTPDQVLELTHIANRVRDAVIVNKDGDTVVLQKEQREAFRDLKIKIAKLKDTSLLQAVGNIIEGFAYANVLSNPNTWTLAFVSGAKKLIVDQFLQGTLSLTKDLFEAVTGQRNIQDIGANFRLFTKAIFAPFAKEYSTYRSNDITRILKGREGVQLHELNVSEKGKIRIDGILNSLDQIEVLEDKIKSLKERGLAGKAAWVTLNGTLAGLKVTQYMSRMLVVADYLSKSLSLPYAIRRELTDMAVRNLAERNPDNKSLRSLADINAEVSKLLREDEVNNYMSALNLKPRDAEYMRRRIKLDFLPVEVRRNAVQYADEIAFAENMFGISGLMGSRVVQGISSLGAATTIESKDSIPLSLVKLLGKASLTATKMAILPFASVPFKMARRIADNLPIAGNFQMSYELDPESGKIIKVKGLKLVDSKVVYKSMGTVDLAETIQMSRTERMIYHATTVAPLLVSAYIFSLMFEFYDGGEDDEEEEGKVITPLEALLPDFLGGEASKNTRVRMKKDSGIIVTGAYSAQMRDYVLANMPGADYYPNTIYLKDSEGKWYSPALVGGYKDDAYGFYFQNLGTIQQKLLLGGSVTGQENQGNMYDPILAADMLGIATHSMASFLGDAGSREGLMRVNEIVKPILGGEKQKSFGSPSNTNYALESMKTAVARSMTPLSGFATYLGNLEGLYQNANKTKGTSTLSKAHANMILYGGNIQTEDFDAVGGGIPFQFSNYVGLQQFEKSVLVTDDRLKRRADLLDTPDKAHQLWHKYSDITRNINKYYPADPVSKDETTITDGIDEVRAFEISMLAAKTKGKFLVDHYDELDDYSKEDLQKSFKTINMHGDGHSLCVHILDLYDKDQNMVLYKKDGTKLDVDGLEKHITTNKLKVNDKIVVDFLGGGEGMYDKKALTDLLILNNVFIKDDKFIRRNYEAIDSEHGSK